MTIYTKTKLKTIRNSDLVVDLFVIFHFKWISRQVRKERNLIMATTMWIRMLVSVTLCMKFVLESESVDPEFIIPIVVTDVEVAYEDIVDAAISISSDHTNLILRNIETSSVNITNFINSSLSCVNCVNTTFDLRIPVAYSTFTFNNSDNLIIAFWSTLTSCKLYFNQFVDSHNLYGGLQIPYITLEKSELTLIDSVRSHIYIASSNSLISVIIMRTVACPLLRCQIAGPLSRNLTTVFLICLV